MAFVKVTKTKAYFKRYQTQFRRRREAKTDYQSRKGLIMQDLNKYLTPKYRLVARITNSRVIAQIAYSTYNGDFIFAEANSHELRKYGLTSGLTSYAAAYATGLLLARRTLATLKMDTIYKGTGEIDGKDYDVAAHADPNRRPFVAVLDVGLRRPTVGNRVFAVMKGACDGGINVPHSTRKFPGFTPGGKDKKGTYESEAHKDRIYGCHVDEYMEHLKDDNDAKKKQFSAWAETLKKAGVATVEDLFKKVFDAIRKDPVRPKKEKKAQKQEFKDEKKSTIVSKKAKKGIYKRDRKITLEQRKQNVLARIEATKKALKK